VKTFVDLFYKENEQKEKAKKKVVSVKG